ncbi:MAG: hypothetical protein Q8R20_03355 [Nanoarchaeota archaeon]|nr:hypothetical protein [Nanoarchaeota archaeon]
MQEETHTTHHKKRRNATNIILVIVSIILAALLIGVVAWRVVEGRDTFHAVFLKTGDLYFGKLVRFPTFGMKNIYFVQATGNEANPLSIQKFTNVFWGPDDVLQINKKEVVWMTKIRKDSDLAELLRTNPDLQKQTVPQAQERTIPEPKGIPLGAPPASKN